MVIVGDHPAFGSARRREFERHVARCADEHIPLVMLNGNDTTWRIDMPRRQCDIYTAMLSLMGLGSYGWHGIAKPDNIPTDRNTSSEYEISSMILAYDLYND
ncbi:hypothetical protein [uncultured Muribaculum sp.]|uniref:hypothetical protein n=1 Tax=uncultured Muribaculum sp. TaxID=1918613 RepID=UPI0025E6A6FC|nr:hypothetical protein [uncultured Muribaculum sp.]